MHPMGGMGGKCPPGCVESTHFNKRIKQMMGSTVRPLWSIEDLLEVGLSLQSNGDRCEKTLLIDGITFFWWWGVVVPHCASTTDYFNHDTLLSQKKSRCILVYSPCFLDYFILLIKDCLQLDSPLNFYLHIPNHNVINVKKTPV